MDVWESTPIAPPDAAAAAAARSRIDRLTKPVGSLGRIEDIAVQLCAIAGGLPSRPLVAKAVLIGAGDHGVCDEGVSAYPSEVTPQMVAAFLAGHAAINAFSRAVGADVYVANFGVRSELAPHALLIDAVVGRGTRNFAREAAFAEGEVERALAAGAAALDDVTRRRDYDVIALGEMGIGNTTAASALVAALTGASASDVVGRGTGVDDAGLSRKRQVVARASAALVGLPWTAVARAVGGYEIVGLAGVILSAAARRMPIVLDGFIVAAAALVAQAIEPNSIGYCIAAHRSAEPGHRIALEALELVPLFDLGLRLGEGSGAALALPLIEAASRMVFEMKTFEEAGVSGAL